mmetsp:Transcript_20999/g.41640  ORF Transcript_20999/g.41640 Transcript_20999/m.41640 type:complete len:201 (-) Transcript_20999:187-789(-)
MQGLPPPTNHLPCPWCAVLYRAPSARRPDLVQLPHHHSKLVRSPPRLDVGFDVQSLPHHALPQVLLEHKLADLVKIASLAAEVHVDDVVARVVALAHRVDTSLTLHAGVHTPMGLLQSRAHTLEGREHGAPELTCKHVLVSRPSLARRERGERDRQVGVEQFQLRCSVSSQEAAAVLVRPMRLDVRVGVRSGQCVAIRQL